MKKQEIILNLSKDFCAEQIFDCGQCFRWNKQIDGSYIGIVRKNVIHVQQTKEQICITSLGEENLKELVDTYFDLNTDYETIKQRLRRVDNYLEKSISYGEGIRILRQDLWEILISFIISANNNIPRIKGIIERLAKQYGEHITWNGQNYYTFPNIEELSKASIEDLRKLGLGFRDKRVYETTKLFKEGKIKIEELVQEKDVQKLREMLMTLSGVGRKVADCIMLFGLHHFEVFPIDIWVQRVMNELYLKKEDESKVNKEEIQKLAKEKYAELAGMAQQYLYYWKRETA